MVTSLFGDQRLYFQHKRFGYDKTYWPNMDWGRTTNLLALETQFDQEVMSWTRATPDGWPRDDPVAAKALFESVVAEASCPFAWFFSDEPELYDQYLLEL